MATWSEILDGLDNLSDRGSRIADLSRQAVAEIAQLSDCNVLYYASSFLQKPQVSGLYTGIVREDINGFMAGVHGHDSTKNLMLILHTPGGSPEAAQAIVEYLRSKYSDIVVVIPTYAMSAGTMIALGCNRIVLGRQSQLGPTDPQLVVENRPVSAHSIVAQFKQAKDQIIQDPVAAHAWAPILRTFGPALLEEARNALTYTQNLVEEWLRHYMFADHGNASAQAREVAKHFGGAEHGSHGRRINRDEARSQGLEIVDLEDNQSLQDKILTLYHLSTIAFEQGPALKSILSSNGRMWVKNMAEAGR